MIYFSLNCTTEFLDSFEENKAAEQVGTTHLKISYIVLYCVYMYIYNYSQEKIRNLEANVVAILEHISQVHTRKYTYAKLRENCAYLVLMSYFILEHGPV